MAKNYRQQFIDDMVAEIEAESARELRQMELQHQQVMQQKKSRLDQLKDLSEKSKTTSLIYTAEQNEAHINSIRNTVGEQTQSIEERMEAAKERMKAAKERMEAAKERMEAFRAQMQQKETENLEEEDIEPEDIEDEDDEEWVDCEDIDYQGVNYSACEGSATANFIIDEDIRILRIPDKIKDEDGNEYVVDEFEIEDLYKVEHLHLPKTLKRVYGCAFERGSKVDIRFLGLGTPSVCFENGIFYSQDIKSLQNTKLADIGSEYSVAEGVEVIEIDAFQDCKQLRVLNLPSSIKKICVAFDGCTSLEVVNIYAKATDIIWDNIDRDDEEVDILPEHVKINYIEAPVQKEKQAKTVKVKVEKDIKASLKNLTISESDKKILGVCGGIAECFGINSTLVRIATIVLAFITQGFMALVYILIYLWCKLK